MIADIVNSTEFLTDATERYLQPSDLVTLQRLRAKQFRRADIDPILVHHLRLACGFVAALLFCRPAKISQDCKVAAMQRVYPPFICQ